MHAGRCCGRLRRPAAALPEGRRVPVFSHWGVTGGLFAKEAGTALAALDFSVVQTFSPAGSTRGGGGRAPR
ncbi:MAG TPA: hypothetical protein VGE16_16805 [Albitalea sp.]